MQLSLDPRDAASVAKAAEMLGLNNKATSSGVETEQREHIDRLQAALDKKRREVATLKAAALAAPAAQAPAPTESGPIPSNPMTALAHGILHGDDNDLLKVPAIGRGAITKMREWARTAHPEVLTATTKNSKASFKNPAEQRFAKIDVSVEDYDRMMAEADAAEPKKQPESPTQSGPEEKSSGDDTAEDGFDEFDDMLNEGGVATKDEEAAPEEPASEEKTYTHEDCRDTLRAFNKTPGKTILQAKAILKEHGFSTVDDIPADKIGTVIKALNKGMRS